MPRPSGTIIKIFTINLPSQPFLGRHLGFHIFFHHSLFEGRTLFLQLGCFGLDNTISTQHTIQNNSTHKLQHTRRLNVLSNNFYFNRIARIWNALPVVDCDLSIPTIKFYLINFLWNHFEQTFDPTNTQCWASYFVKVTSYILHITCN